MNVTTRRQVRLVRRVGATPPHRYQWGCRLDSTPGGLDVHIAAPDGPGPALSESGEKLHDGLLERMPPMLRSRLRSEVGVVVTETQVSDRPLASRCHAYALVTCADVVLTLVSQLSPEPVIPWRGTCPASALDPELPVIFGPSAVLSLTAGALEMREGPEGPEGPECTRDDGSPDGAKVNDKEIPDWMSVRSVSRSPYPPHDTPLGLEDVPDGQRGAIAYWATHTEHWMRPMRTTRASRGQYEVRTALPPAPAGPALWVEVLTSLDTRGRYWQASLSADRDGGRWWVTQPWPVEARARKLLGAAVGQVEPLRPALDRDPVDGESFGWAPALLTGYTAGMLGLRRSPR